MEKKILRLLIVDDSPDDAEIPVKILREAGYMIKSQRAYDLATMEAAMHKGKWDLVISEHAMPQFSSGMALDLVNRSGRDIPFLVFTRQIDDAGMQSIMTAGAHDVITKDQQGRLLPAIKREMRNLTMRNELRRLNQQRDEIDKNREHLLESSREALAYVNEGIHVDANDAYMRIFGFEDKEDLTVTPLLGLIGKEDQERFKSFLRKTKSWGEPQEFSAIKQDGGSLYIAITLSEVTHDNELCTQISVTDVTKRQAAENKLRYLSQHDPLTGLLGRHYFMRELNKTIEQIKAGEDTRALYYFNVDMLTSINEKLGYAAGDRLLIKLSKLIADLIGKNGMVARLGGDEFAGVVKMKSEREGRAFLEAIRNSLKAIQLSEGKKNQKCSCSASFIFLDSTVDSAQTVLTLAYNECEKSKTYKKRISSADLSGGGVKAEVSKDTNPSDAMWSKRIKEALDKDLFELAYQPVVNLHSEASELYEVLLRINEGGGSLIAARDFIPAAERCGMLEAIDTWVIQHAIEALANMQAEGRDTSLFVNISGSSFFNKSLPSFIVKTLKSASVPPSHLILELDDRDLTAFPEEATELIKRSKAMGCQISIDNFGTGMGSADLLKRLPIHYLKLSGSLLKDIDHNPFRENIFRIMLELAALLEKTTVAKGVENAAILGVLWQHQIDFVQGYYFQQEDGEAGYDFDNESTLGSDEAAAPSWSQP